MNIIDVLFPAPQYKSLLPNNVTLSMYQFKLFLYIYQKPT